MNIKTFGKIIGSVLLLAIVYLFLSAFRLTHNTNNSSEKMRDKKIIAHRGGADLGPENSLYCIGKGIEAGADMIEIDVHLSKDGEVMVCHDPKVDRTTNGKGTISKMTYDELRQLYLLDDKGNTTTERMPTLDEVMNLVKGKAGLLIEIKRDRSSLPGIEEKVLNAIKQHEAYSWATVQSFNDSVLEEFHKLDPNVRLEKLFIFKLWGLPLIFDGSLSRLDYNKYNYVSSFNIMQTAINKKLVDDIHKKGKEVKIWTIKAPNKKSNLPVDGIITDRPDLWNSSSNTQ